MKPSPLTPSGEGSSSTAAPGSINTDIPLREMSYSSGQSSPNSSSPLEMKVETGDDDEESTPHIPPAYQPPEGSSPGPEIELDYGHCEGDEAPILRARPKSGKPQWRKSKMIEPSDWGKADNGEILVRGKGEVVMGGVKRKAGLWLGSEWVVTVIGRKNYCSE